jgi:uncharacterized membrane protein HdeD (DUF308 family)
MGKKWRSIFQLLLSVLIVVLGIFILIRQDLFKQIFVISLGVILLYFSIRTLIISSKYTYNKFNRNSTLLKAILGIVIGVLAIVMPLTTGATVWMILLYSIAAQLTIAAVILLLDAFALRDSGFPISPLVVEGVLSLAVAVSLFVFPQNYATMLVTILGVAIILVGVVVGIVSYFGLKKKDELEVEVEILE